MSRKFNIFTMSAVAITLLSGIALTGCSNSDDDTTRCCGSSFWQNGFTNGGNNGDGGNTGDDIAGMMAAEDGEFSILPVEEPIVIDDQGTGDGGNTFQEIWDEHTGNDNDTTIVEDFVIW